MFDSWVSRWPDCVSPCESFWTKSSTKWINCEMWLRPSVVLPGACGLTRRDNYLTDITGSNICYLHLALVSMSHLSQGWLVVKTNYVEVDQTSGQMELTSVLPSLGAASLQRAHLCGFLPVPAGGEHVWGGGAAVCLQGHHDGWGGAGGENTVSL